MTKWSLGLSGYDARVAKNNLRYLIWTIIWVATWILADKAELYEWHSSASISIASIIVNALAGLAMMDAYRRLLRGMDDLQQKVQLDALALSVGIGLVGGVIFSLLAEAQLIANAEASDVIMLLCITFPAATIVGQIRYR